MSNSREIPADVLEIALDVWEWIEDRQMNAVAATEAIARALMEQAPRWIPVTESRVGAHEWAYVFDRIHGPREAQCEPELIGGIWICRTGLRLWAVTHVYPLPPGPVPTTDE